MYRLDPWTGAWAQFNDRPGGGGTVIAADASSVWAVGTVSYTQNIYRVPLAGGSPTLLGALPNGGLTSLTSAGEYLYGTTYFNEQIIRINKTDGTWISVAGGTTGYQDGTGAAVKLNSSRLAFDGGNLWITDTGNARLRVAPSGQFPVVGQGTFGDDGYGAWWDDVNGAAGNFVTSDTDASVSTVGPDLELARTYNSAETRAAAFGIGWSFAYGMNWQYLGGGVAVTYPDGRRELHSKLADGTYKPPLGYYSSLASDGAGGFILTAKDRAVHRFGTNGKLVSVTDADGHRVDLVYDGSGHLASATDAVGGRTLTFGWTGSYITSVSTGSVAAHGGPLTWRYYYSGDKLTRVCDPRNNADTGSCSVYTWTGSRITRVARPNGHTEVDVAYLADGKVDWRQNGASNRTTFSYPATGTVRITDPRTHVTVQDYDSANRLIRETDPANKITTYGYDSRGNRSSITDANLNTVVLSYDARGNLTASTDPENRVTYYSYDGGDNRTAVRDARSSGPTDATYATTSTYSSSGNRLTATTPATAGFPSGVTRSWTYTTGTEAAPGGGTMPAGLVRTAVDGRGKTTTHSYNSAGDLVEVVDRVGLRTTYAHDELGRKTSETVYSDTYPAGTTTTITYDVLSNVVTTTEPAATNVVTGATTQRRTTTTYDGNENVTEVKVEDPAVPGSARITSQAYDLADRPTTTTDAEAGGTTRGYDPAGNVVSVTDAENRVVTVEYDNRNLATKVVAEDFVDDPIGGSTPRDVTVRQFGYDPARRRTTETDALGRTRRLAYDKADRLTSTTLLGYDNRDGSNRDIVLGAATYDPAGRLLTETAGGGLRLVVNVWDNAGRLATSTLDPSALNRVTSSAYDGEGNVTSRTIAAGGRTEQVRLAYDDGGRKLSETTENGVVDLVTTFAWDKRGLPTAVVDARGNAAGAVAADFTTNVVNDAVGRRVRTIGAPVSVEENGGTAVTTRPAIETGFNAFGEATKEREPRGSVTTSTFDRLGRRTRIDHPNYTTPDNTAVAAFETFGYDKVGNLVSRTDRRGKTTNWTFDARNRAVQQLDPLITGESGRGAVRLAYDDAGNTVSRSDQRGAVTESTYDDLDRARTETAVVRQATGAAARYTSTFDHDDLGNRTYEQDPLGKVVRHEFSAAAEGTRDLDQLDKATTYGRDVAGRVTSVTDPLGRRTEADYDLAGRNTAVRRYAPNGTTPLTTETFGVDGVGNVTAVTSARSKTTSNVYDAGNRLVSVTEPVATGTSITTSYGRDAAGNPTRITDGRGNTTVATYTAWQQRQSVIEPSTTAHPAAADRTFTTVYDAGGLPVEDRAPGGVVVGRSFDEGGRLRSETGTGTGLATATRTFSYDRAGLRTSVSHPAGTIGFSYDDRGLPTSVTGPAGAAGYSYDAAGRLLTRTDAAGTETFTWTDRGQVATAADTMTGTTRTNTWDDAGQLQTVGYGSGNRNFDWDDLGRVTSDELANSSGTVKSRETYGYDPDGNLTSRNVEFPGTSGNTAVGSSTYRYDDAGRLAGWTPPGSAEVAYTWDGAGNRTGAGAASYSYDERNRLVAGPGTTYAWSARGIPTSETTAGGTTTFGFDALDRMTNRNGTAFTYDGLDRVATRAGTAFQYAGTELDPVTDGAFTYARGVDGSILATSNGTTTALAGLDRHGDLTHLYDAAGSVTSTKTFNPFGEVAGSSGTMQPTAGYQGDYTDPTSGAVWMGARWYEPGTARFLSRDTYSGMLSTPVSLNRYSFANADPMEFLDADGRCGLSLSGAADCLRRGARKGARIVGKGIGGAANAGSAVTTAISKSYETAQALVARGQQRVQAAVVKAAKAVGNAVVAPIKACANSSACRTVAVATAVVATAIVCTACAVAGAIGAGIGAGVGAVTCNGDMACVGRSALVGAAGGVAAPIGGGGFVGALIGGGAAGAASGAAGQVMAGRFDGRALGVHTLGGMAAGGALHFATPALSRAVGALARRVAPSIGSEVGAISFGGARSTIKTPYGVAEQAYDDASLALRQHVEQGGTVYRQGVTGTQQTAEGQFWSGQNPASAPGYANTHGLPGTQVEPGEYRWIMGGTIEQGTPFVTRPAPGLGSNLGGAPEAVVDPGGVKNLWFHMPD